MSTITIFVAGPVLRSDHSSLSLSLKTLYQRIENDASLAGVSVQIPRVDQQLDLFEPMAFAQEIDRRIRASDALLALIDVPGARAGANYSVAVEAQSAARAGKPIAMVAQNPDQVPRLLAALCEGREIHQLETVDFQGVLRNLAAAAARGDVALA